MIEPWKTEVAGTRHMAVAGHYLAAHAAFIAKLKDSHWDS